MVTMLVIIAAGGPFPALLQVASGDSSPVDLPTLGTYYASAAPFVAICLWFMIRFMQQVAKLQAENTQLREDRLHDRDQQIAKAEALNMRLGPMVYDSALLYKQGTEVIKDAASPSLDPATRAQDSHLAALDAKLSQLLARLEGRDGP